MLRDLDSIYVTYWSLNDPLCASQSLPVLRGLAAGGYSVGLVTYESDRWAPSREAERQARQSLEAAGIAWFPLRYHKRPRLLAKAFDLVAGVALCWRLARCRRVRLLHGRGTVAALVAGCAAWLSGRLFFDDADSPISEEYADIGIWRRGGTLHRLVGCAERWALRRAGAIAVLTQTRRTQVSGISGAPVVVIPCGVDVDAFRRDEDARVRLRRELGLAGLVFVYVGKSGGWYATEAMLDFAVAASRRLEEMCLLVGTPESPETFAAPATARGIRCIVRTVAHEDMAFFLSAADVALSFVRPLPSKKSSSPVKNGEYLACGLPIVSTAGIGDYSALIASRRVGVVVDALNSDAYERALEDLLVLLRDPEVGSRCRAVAEDEVSLSRVVLARYREIYADLLGEPKRVAS